MAQDATGRIAGFVRKAEGAIGNALDLGDKILSEVDKHGYVAREVLGALSTRFDEAVALIEPRLAQYERNDADIKARLDEVPIPSREDMEAYLSNNPFINMPAFLVKHADDGKVTDLYRQMKATELVKAERLSAAVQNLDINKLIDDLLKDNKGENPWDGGSQGYGPEDL